MAPKSVFVNTNPSLLEEPYLQAYVLLMVEHQLSIQKRHYYVLIQKSNTNTFPELFIFIRCLIYPTPAPRVQIRIEVCAILRISLARKNENSNHRKTFHNWFLTSAYVPNHDIQFCTPQFCFVCAVPILCYFS